MWEDVEKQENFPVSAGFVITTQWCKSKSITTQPPHSYMVEEGAYGQTPNLDRRKTLVPATKKFSQSGTYFFTFFSILQQIIRK